MNSNEHLLVLLIDDDEDDRDFFEIAVSDLKIKIQCLTAAGAREALDLLATIEVLPHFIFLDLNMPGMNGRVCLKHLKSNPATAQIPVVIFSTSSEQLDMAQTKALGAMHFMTKLPDISLLSIELNEFFTQQFQKQQST